MEKKKHSKRGKPASSLPIRLVEDAEIIWEESALVEKPGWTLNVILSGEADGSYSDHLDVRLSKNGDPRAIRHLVEAAVSVWRRREDVAAQLESGSWKWDRRRGSWVYIASLVKTALLIDEYREGGAR